MSQTETHFGKLRKVEIPVEKTLEQWCESKCNEVGITQKESYNSNWYEELKDQHIFYKKYFFVKNEVWEAFEHIEQEEGDDDIYYLQPNKDGTLTFILTSIKKVRGNNIYD